MSVVTIAEVKAYLNQIHSLDDVKIQYLIDAAEDEAKRFLDRDELPRRDDPFASECQSDSTADAASDSNDIAPSVRTAIMVLVQALYEGTEADEIEKLRYCALTIMRSYRGRMGV